jgi:hypothetical protein
LNQIGDITLRQVYEKSLELKERLSNNIGLEPKYLNIATGFVSYGLMLRGYKKFIEGSIPDSIKGEELKIIQRKNIISRRWFGLVVASALVLCTQAIFNKGPYVTVNVINNDSDNNLKKQFMFGFITLYKKASI